MVEDVEGVLEKRLLEAFSPGMGEKSGLRGVRTTLF